MLANNKSYVCYSGSGMYCCFKIWVNVIQDIHQGLSSPIIPEFPLLIALVSGAELWWAHNYLHDIEIL